MTKFRFTLLIRYTDFYIQIETSNSSKGFQTCLCNVKILPVYTSIQMHAFVVQCTKRNDQRNVGSRPESSGPKIEAYSNTSKYQRGFCEDEDFGVIFSKKL